jgi:hypothetical protein
MSNEQKGAQQVKIVGFKHLHLRCERRARSGSRRCVKVTEVGKRTKYEDTTPARLLGHLKRMYEWKASGKKTKKV